jgi:hypothetical protein
MLSQLPFPLLPSGAAEIAPLQLTVIRPTQDPQSWHKSCPVTRLLHLGSRVRKCMLALLL